MLKYQNICALWGLSLILISCGGGSGSASGSGSSATAATSLTIDNTAVVPVFGTNPTSTVVYVHNNSAVTITNINYSLSSNAQTASQANKLSAATDSQSGCST